MSNVASTGDFAKRFESFAALSKSVIAATGYPTQVVDAVFKLIERESGSAFA